MSREYSIGGPFGGGYVSETDTRQYQTFAGYVAENVVPGAMVGAAALTFSTTANAKLSPHIDSFNRADANLESSTTPSGNSFTWSHDGAISGALSIASNQIRSNTTDATGSAYTAVTHTSADHYVQYKVVDITVATGSFFTTRMADKNNFVGVRSGFVSSNGQVQVFRRVSGTLTSLYVSGAGAVAVNDILRLVVSGSNFTVYKNNSVLTGPTAIGDGGALSSNVKTGILARTVSSVLGDDFETDILTMAGVGSSTLTFASTATIGATGAMVGSSTLTFTPTATPDVPGLVGVSTLTFSQTGALTGVGALGGVSTLTFSQTGTLAATGAVSGTIPFTFSQTAVGGLDIFVGPPFTDNFNRVDSNLEVNPFWTWDTLIAGAAAVTSGQLGSATSSSTGSAYQAPNLGSADQYVQYRVKAIATDVGSFVACRLQDVSNFVGIRTGKNVTNGFVEVYRRVAGTLTSLYVSPTDTVAIDDVVKLEVVGNNFTVYKNGAVLTGPTAIGAVLTSTRSGVVMRTTIGTPLWDDFETGRYSTGGGGNGIAGGIYDFSYSLQLGKEYYG